MDEFPKDPGDELDFGRRWKRWLQGDRIQSSTWAIQDDDGTLVIVESTHNDDTTTVWLRDGTPGRRYTLVNRIVTWAGRVCEKPIFIELADDL